MAISSNHSIDHFTDVVVQDEINQSINQFVLLRINYIQVIEKRKHGRRKQTVTPYNIQSFGFRLGNSIKIAAKQFRADAGAFFAIKQGLMSGHNSQPYFLRNIGAHQSLEPYTP